jgi:hypothetical protein
VARKSVAIYNVMDHVRGGRNPPVREGLRIEKRGMAKGAKREEREG